MPTRHISISTATGTFGPVDMGDVYRRATIAINNASTLAGMDGTVEGSIGGSGNWTTVITLTTANSTGAHLTATGVPFDKLRLVTTTNESTSVMPAWLSASN